MIVCNSEGLDLTQEFPCRRTCFVALNWLIISRWNRSADRHLVVVSVSKCLNFCTRTKTLFDRHVINYYYYRKSSTYHSKLLLEMCWRHKVLYRQPKTPSFPQRMHKKTKGAGWHWKRGRLRVGKQGKGITLTGRCEGRQKCLAEEDRESYTAAYSHIIHVPSLSATHL